MTVSAAVLTDLLSTAATPAAAAPATPSQATQTPTPPSSTTATVPPLMCEPSERYTSAAGPVETQQARTHPSRSTASTSESSDSSDEDVSVGTPPPPRKHPYSAEDFLQDTTSTTASP
ncbi:mucin-7-like [Procambarus clarkii]|uniref:mucin-7-like n=1 Tax=Procambarus clarkii TaxID=6728 RepID=UPI00374449A0